MSCNTNPCRTHQHNTAACESLPSQISNFTAQFFGEVVKTEIDGAVAWSLPCGLETGLPNNPRGSGEGLACYFLRLFEEGIIGLTGPAGIQGTPGCNGFNAYTVTLLSFQQPTLAFPGVQVLTAFNPGILEGSYVFIATSGLYLVNNAHALSIPGCACELSACYICRLACVFFTNLKLCRRGPHVCSYPIDLQNNC